jgi:hypothetical protein
MSHSATTCPDCCSPCLVGSHLVPTFLSSTNVMLHNPHTLFQDVTTHIYKPPRIAS